jgi:N-acetylmuramoyl-L-alanine amidase
MGKYLWLIDAGHGGKTNYGVYTTAPAKMVVYPDGYEIFEGVVNRKIAEKLYIKCSQACFDWALIYDDVLDTDLTTRINIANRVYEKDKRAVVLSIHSNASPDGIDKPGTGFEVFTSPGQTSSDPIASVFCDKCIELYPGKRFRSDKSDGDMDKEAKFAILTRTMCPAILVESLFMDNREEAEYLNSEEGQEAIAEWLFQSILEVEKTQPI